MSYNTYGIGTSFNVSHIYNNNMNNLGYNDQSRHWMDYKDDYSISKNSSYHSVDNVNDDEPFDLEDDYLDDEIDNIMEEKKVIINNQTNFNTYNNYNLPSYNYYGNKNYQFIQQPNTFDKIDIKFQFLKKLIN